MCAAERQLTLQPVRAALLTCLATREALDGLAASGSGLCLRIAPDEALLAAPVQDAGAFLCAARASLRTVDAHSLVVDVTDAWAMWALSGPVAAAALGRLTSVPIVGVGEGFSFSQGAVAGVPARLLALPDRFCVLVSSTLAHHFRDRVLQWCADMQPQLLPPWTFAVPAGAAGAGGAR